MTDPLMCDGIPFIPLESGGWMCMWCHERCADREAVRAHARYATDPPLILVSRLDWHRRLGEMT